MSCTFVADSSGLLTSPYLAEGWAWRGAPNLGASSPEDASSQDDKNGTLEMLARFILHRMVNAVAGNMTSSVLFYQSCKQIPRS